MTSSPALTHSLIDELQAITVGIGHARHLLGKDKYSETNDLWQRLETCACDLAKLDRNERDKLRPVLLTLLDELQKTISAFDAEHQDLGNKLKSTHRNMAAGAAYRQARAR